MGSSNSKNSQSGSVQEVQIPQDALINRLRTALRLSFSKNSTKLTHSFVYGGFSSQIIKNNASKIYQNNSPFCSIFLKDSKTKENILISCAMISPIMIIAPSSFIRDSSGFVFQNNIKIISCVNEKWIEISVNKIIPLKNKKIAYLILDTPMWEIGWCGLTYLQSPNQITENPFHLIKNQIQKSEKLLSETIPVIHQTISRAYFNDIGNLKGKGLRQSRGIVFQIIERKPYISGLQDGFQCQFFDLYTIKDLQQKANQFLTESKEKYYLKKIDIQQMEIQTNW